MKRISPATVTFGVMALVLGLVAAYIVKQAMHKPPVAKVVVPPPAPAPIDPGVQVVFARNNIPKSGKLLPADLLIAYVPRTSKAAKGTFANVAIAEGRITNQIIKAGQAIREEYLLEIGEALPDLADRLPAGMRAVTVSVANTESGGKRFGEGDYVDISLTVEGTHPEIGEVATRTLMRNVLVVDSAASRPLIRGVNTRVQRNVQTLTVAVKPADANKLVVAQRTGVLSVNLVAAKDLEAEPIEGSDIVTRRQLLGLKEVVPAKPAKKYVVEKWSGGRLNVVEMSDDRVKESRDVNTTSKPIAAPPAEPKFNTSYIPSGVTEPVDLPAEVPAEVLEQ
ncbi:Flp pilus assembly protein CpaB [Anatilimnocola floriformis]|uniref:Flp pilus assembly protein CpaB n=1 Tax=Anatilimnocola floriformis TaxID=2948575 RepID=UPI0020C2FC66|nr:Flp pilus assembly protein CpaB [Anatilimnocola floriformis]